MRRGSRSRDCEVAVYEPAARLSRTVTLAAWLPVRVSVSLCVIAAALIVSEPPPVAIERAEVAPVVTLKAPLGPLAARLPTRFVTVAAAEPVKLVGFRRPVIGPQ